jgi:soluble lytic murein transglycosylase-like protein
LAREISPAFLREPESAADTVLETYADGASREWVISFFARLCGSAELAEIMLEEAARYAVSPSLAFALSWEESRYNCLAVNRQNRDGSVDRGLFQLNNGSFPKLSEQEFFSPRINTAYGMAHLRLCLDAGGSEVTALAMYNAGTGRVRSGGTPQQTLDYTARVLAARRKIDRIFLEEWTGARQFIGHNAGLAEESGEAGEIPADPVEIAALDGFGPPRPILLHPLSR